MQMTLLSFTTRPYGVRASKISISHCHNQAGRSHNQPVPDKEAIPNPEAWFVKVACTLFLHVHPLDTCSGYLGKKLTPVVALEVIRRLNNPKLSLRFFEFSRENLSIRHSFGTYNLLLRSLCQMCLHDSAKMVFDCMRIDGWLPNGSLVGFMVSSFAQVGKFDIAKILLFEARRNEVRVNCGVYNNLLNIMIRQNKVQEALCFFKECLELQFCPDTWTFNIIISGLCRIREVDKAFQFFADMFSFAVPPDIVTYNTLINGFCRVNEVDKGFDLLKKMQVRRRILPDVVTYTSIIRGYCRLGRMGEASILYDEMISSRTNPNSFTYNVLIDGFGKVGNMVSALAMYEKMISLNCAPDVITFTSLIDGYCRIGEVKEGLKIWDEMNKRNLSPNLYTFAIIINSLCSENRLSEARGFLRQLKKRIDIIPKPFVYNPVIDGFCKAGNVDEANEIVAEMKENKCKPDKVTYTILIIGYCMRGAMSKAITVFNTMLDIGCSPDTITVSSLISCLVKAGMPNEATRIKKMIKDLNSGMPSLKRPVPLRANVDIPIAV